MTINDSNILFDSQTSEEHGVMMVYSVGSVAKSGGDEKSNIVLTKNSFKETHDLHYISYDEPLTFSIILVKTDNSYIDSNDERRLNKWLCKPSWKWLQIDQTDLSEIYYYCIINNPEKVDISGYNGAIKYDVTCDCHHAWSRLYKKPYTTVNGTLTVNLNHSFDYDEYILHPQLIITSLSSIAQTISIKNNTTNETLSLEECVLNEQITIDCKNDKLSSSTDRVLISKWNKSGISFIDGNNQLVLTGDFKVEFQYRLPIRIGG